MTRITRITRLTPHLLILVSGLVGNLASCVANSLSAQETAGPLAPAGQLRFGIASSIWSVDSRFGTRIVDGTRVDDVEPLGFDLSGERLDASRFPGLIGLESDLRVAADDPRLVLNLGRTRVEVGQTTIRVPFQADLGVTDWLTLGITVPLIRRRSEVELAYSADSLTSDLGVSPSVTSSAATSAFLADVSAANTDLQAQVDTFCGTDPASADCLGAQAALADGESFHASLADAYASGLFALSGSAAGDALLGRLDDLTSVYASYGVPAMPPGAALPLAEAPLGGEALGILLTEPAFGVAGAPLRTRQGLWELGDIEVTGALRLLELGAAGPGSTFGRPYILLGAGGLVRLGTGAGNDPDRFFDPGSAYGRDDGQMDLELRGFTDLQFGSGVGLSAHVRRGIQTEAEVLRRIAPPEVVLAPLSSKALVRWDPGDYWILDASPRWRLTPELSVATRYRLWKKGADEYALVDPAVADPGTDGPGLDPSVLERETEQTRHEVGVSLMYSTLAVSESESEAADTRPMEVRFRYLRAVAGSGGATPKGSRVEVSLRLFWNLWGG